MTQLKTIIDTVLECVNERISQIDYNQKKYKCDISSHGNYSYVLVKYDNEEFLRVFPPIPPNEYGRKTCNGIFHVYSIDDAWWYNNPLTHKDINIDEKMMCEGKAFNEVLAERLPLRDKKEIQEIEKVLQEKGIIHKSIRFETINRRYIINLIPRLEECQQTPFNGNCVYKYTSLKTFLEIAKNKKMRLNSIVSMNDTSEAFFLGDYLCDAYKDYLREKFELGYDEMDKDGLRYTRLLDYKNLLIGSFTTNEDEPIMWERYGDNYKGVCIGFKINPGIMHPIIYCGRNQNDFFYNLKTIAEQLSKKGIAIYYDFIKDEQFFVKHWQFKSENELRLLKKCNSNDKKFKFDLYGNLITYYREYPLNKLGLEPVSLWIGAKMSNKDTNYPIICDLANSNLGIKDINISKCNKYRL